MRRVTPTRSTARSAAKSPLGARGRTIAEHWQRVLRVVLHVGARLDADLSLARLSRLAHLSPYHFQRVFAAATGESCKQHVRRLRLERAALELRDTERAIAGIALDAGYADVPSFYRAFGAHFGTSPAGFRERAARAGRPAMPPASLRRWQVTTDEHGQLHSISHAAASAPADAGSATRLVQLARLRLAFVRRTGPLAARAAFADFARLVAFASRKSAMTDPLLMRLHHDDPAITPSPLRRIDHAIVIGPRRRGEGDIGTQTIGGCALLAATCAGGIASAAATRRWLETAGRAAHGAARLHGPCIEIVLDWPVDRPARARDLGASLRDVLVPVALPAAAYPWYWRRRASNVAAAANTDSRRPKRDP